MPSRQRERESEQQAPKAIGCIHSSIQPFRKPLSVSALSSNRIIGRLASENARDSDEHIDEQVSRAERRRCHQSEVVRDDSAGHLVARRDEQRRRRGGRERRDRRIDRRVGFVVGARDDRRCWGGWRGGGAHAATPDADAAIAAADAADAAAAARHGRLCSRHGVDQRSLARLPCARECGRCCALRGSHSASTDALHHVVCWSVCVCHSCVWCVQLSRRLGRWMTDETIPAIRLQSQPQPQRPMEATASTHKEYAQGYVRGGTTDNTMMPWTHACAANDRLDDTATSPASPPFASRHCRCRCCSPRFELRTLFPTPARGASTLLRRSSTPQSWLRPSTEPAVRPPSCRTSVAAAVAVAVATRCWLHAFAVAAISTPRNRQSAVGACSAAVASRHSLLAAHMRCAVAARKTEPRTDGCATLFVLRCARAGRRARTARGVSTQGNNAQGVIRVQCTW